MFTWYLINYVERCVPKAVTVTDPEEHT